MGWRPAIQFGRIRNHIRIGKWKWDWALAALAALAASQHLLGRSWLNLLYARKPMGDKDQNQVWAEVRKQATGDDGRGNGGTFARERGRDSLDEFPTPA